MWNRGRQDIQGIRVRGQVETMFSEVCGNVEHFCRSRGRNKYTGRVENMRRKMIMEKGLRGHIREMGDSIGGELALMKRSKTTAENRKEGQSKDFKKFRGVGEES